MNGRVKLLEHRLIQLSPQLHTVNTCAPTASHHSYYFGTYFLRIEVLQSVFYCYVGECVFTVASRCTFTLYLTLRMSRIKIKSIAVKERRNTNLQKPTILVKV